MVWGTRSRGRGKRLTVTENNGGGIGEYEESRAQRIKENMERMKSLGIVELSKKLTKKPPFASSSSSIRKNKPQIKPPNRSPRRSSRLKDMPQVSYSEKRTPNSKKDESVKNLEIHIPQGEKPEIYTDEHEKLLGDSEAAWTLLVDGYDEDGQRMYDPHEGKSCHQCRQKTRGRHTECSKCKLVTGQFCGDCLYMRYGENVIEVNENPSWVCPFCRGICNCSRCRRENGWAPTGAIYRKAVNLGFKSVAHYLIQTFHERAVTNAETGEDQMSEDGSRSIEDGKEESSEALPSPPTSSRKAQKVEEDVKQDSDEDGDVDSESSDF